MVDYIANLMNKTPNIKYIIDRKSHDIGYKVSTNKLKQLGWQSTTSFQQGMQKTIDWYLDNPHFYD